MKTPDGASEGLPNEDAPAVPPEPEDFDAMVNRSRAWIDELTELLRASRAEEVQEEKGPGDA